MDSNISLNQSVRIDLPTLLDTRLLVQANSGGGKSWLLRRLLEQSHGKVQQIVIRPLAERPWRHLDISSQYRITEKRMELRAGLLRLESVETKDPFPLFCSSARFQDEIRTREKPPRSPI
jgi:hypothetical protein